MFPSKVCVYENPDTSEIAREYSTLDEALNHPAQPKAQIIQNGQVLANERAGRWILTDSVA